MIRKSTALVGYGALDFVRSDGASGGNDPTGVYLAGGLGYDFWISDEWSIGPFARFMYARMSAEEDTAKASESYIYPSIGAAFTLH